MTDYLLQQGREDYWPHLNLVAPLHRAYAKRHGMKYVSYRGVVIPEWRWGGWDHIPLILALVGREDAGWVFWLDADTLIVGDADPRDVMDGYLVGMARHPGPPEHYNTGVKFLKACKEVGDLLQRVLDSGPGVHPWYEQNFMNQYLAEPQWAGKIKTLPNEWNSTVVLGHPEQCIIRAWHGFSQRPAARLVAMQREITRRGL